MSQLPQSQGYPNWKVGVGPFGLGFYHLLNLFKGYVPTKKGTPKEHEGGKKKKEEWPSGKQSGESAISTIH